MKFYTMKENKLKARIEQYFDNYNYYYKDSSDGKYYKVKAFDVDPTTNKIVSIGFKNANFNKKEEVKENFKNPRFIEYLI